MKTQRKTWIWLAVLSCGLGLSTIWYTALELPAHRWARGHLGDALTVYCIYALCTAFTSLRPRTKVLAVGGFAATVELSQLLLPGIRGQATNLLVGSHFDLLDMLHFALGIAAAYFTERYLSKTSTTGTT